MNFTPRLGKIIMYLQGFSMQDFLQSSWKTHHKVHQRLLEGERSELDRKSNGLSGQSNPSGRDVGTL